MEINNIRSTSSISESQKISANVQTTSTPSKPKPILDGGLSVSMAERNVLEEMQRIEDVEEPSLDDALGTMVQKAFSFAPPDIPHFI